MHCSGMLSTQWTVKTTVYLPHKLFYVFITWKYQSNSLLRESFYTMMIKLSAFLPPDQKLSLGLWLQIHLLLCISWLFLKIVVTTAMEMIVPYSYSWVCHSLCPAII